ncbi:hypothetical protein K227x_43850 [Rubripirellula lacrimiformis]|uniref:Uncharacterized protein n=1 Tax=Rubripirellula lacrimiformis TaxID=1930273 RepID=A0A517NFY2_9BACT|nr:hypothetical protein K227x_43850 [Rubripirellula lacrimiformis]
MANRRWSSILERCVAGLGGKKSVNQTSALSPLRRPGTQVLVRAYVLISDSSSAILAFSRLTSRFFSAGDSARLSLPL